MLFSLESVGISDEIGLKICILVVGKTKGEKFEIMDFGFGGLRRKERDGNLWRYRERKKGENLRQRGKTETYSEAYMSRE